MSVVSRLQAPKEDGAILAEPPLRDIPQLVAQNRQLRQNRPGTILGQDFQHLCRQARQSALAAARDYLRDAGEIVPEISADSLLLAGHQPELFHPGVWIKNFALNRLARDCGAIPVNLVVDNDAVKSTALHVPKMIVPPPPIEEFSPTLLFLAFDHGKGDAPYEERSVEDEAFFASFPERLEHNWGFTPLLHEFWSEVRRQAKRTPLLGERFAAARRQYERRWGCHNLELPVSRLCDTEPYRWFLLHILAELPRFHALYNRTVRDHRRRYDISSNNHPVPDLAADGDWLETPFWSWKAGQKRRSRLFARLRQDRIELRSGQEHWPALANVVHVSRHTPWAVAAVHALEQMRCDGYKIRSRALTNTLYARVFLGDLFLHGIGGGKYDELTDELIRGFFGMDPPHYLVLSGTLLLPFPPYPATDADCRRLQHRLRELHYNPQRHLGEVENLDPAAGCLIQEKQHWIEKRWSNRHERLDRFHKLHEITAALRGYLATQEAMMHRRLEERQLQVHANSILQRRDFAFCLYPEEMLRRFCSQFL